MPIPQLEKKKTPRTHQQYARDASSVRKKRAATRSGKTPHSSGALNGRKKKDEQKNTHEMSTLRKLFLRENLLKTFGLFVLASIGSGLMVLGILFAWVSKDLASIADLDKRAAESASKIYASDGETILYEVGDNKRIEVKFDDINKNIVYALISLEDRRFYEHKGYDVIGLARAVAKLVWTRDFSNAQGASTLTQQFVGNAITSRERTLTRKIKELILSVRLERKYSKDEILEFYLNDIYFGSNFQGVEAAAQGFFGKSAKDVSLSEAAILGAMPKNSYALARDPERLKARRDHALTVMAESDYITKEEAEATIAEPIPEMNDSVSEIKAPHFVFYVLDYLAAAYGENAIHRDGLKIITTLDWDKQQKAEEAVRNGMAKIEQYGGSNAALVSMDTHTGKILAMVGSRDFFDTENDGQVNVTTSLRQPGSSFKPAVYLEAFNQGYTPETKLYDVETDFLTEAEGKYHPRNYNLGEHGPVTLRFALSQSLNIPAVKILYMVGVDSALNLAEQLGYTSLRDRSRFGLSLVLGGAEVSLLEHVAAYATFAREGEHHDPKSILKIESKDGKKLEEFINNSKQVIDSKPARMLNSVLSDSGARGAGFSGLNLSDRPAAAKTGTTNDYRDAWTIGYTPSIATGVWVGNNNNTEMNRGAAGLVIAAPIWKEYMNNILSGTPVETFKQPTYTAASEALGGNLDELVTYTVDTVTGEKIPDSCVDGYPEEYITTKEFKRTHTILHYIDRFNPTGDAPNNPRDDVMYEPWETAVIRWTQESEQQNEYASDTIPEVACDFRNENQQPTVAITSLDYGETYTKSDLRIKALVEPGEGRTITSVEYLIDVVTVDNADNLGITSEKTVTSNYTPRNLTYGKHTVTVRITDDNGNFTEDTVKIDYKQ